MQPTVNEVKERLDQASAVIKRLNRVDLAGWVCYLLEVLDCPDQVDNETFLVTVRDALDTRLSEGRW